jgi:hypothetical protein
MKLVNVRKTEILLVKKLIADGHEQVNIECINEAEADAMIADLRASSTPEEIQARIFFHYKTPTTEQAAINLRRQGNYQFN